MKRATCCRKPYVGLCQVSICHTAGVLARDEQMLHLCVRPVLFIMSKVENCGQAIAVSRNQEGSGSEKVNWTVDVNRGQ